MTTYPKDLRVSFSISQDNSDSYEFPNTSHSMHNEYGGAQWIRILEDVIKILEASYGYDIHSKVYYTVACPLFDHDLSPAPGRELNLSVFKEVIKRYPELNNGGEHQRSEIFYSTSEEDEEEENDEDSSNS